MAVIMIMRRWREVVNEEASLMRTIDGLEIPERSESMHSVFFASLHQLLVPFVIGSDEDNFSFPRLVDFLQNLDQIWSTFPGFGVPKEASFWAEVVMNEG